jgi:hypothetical protein
MIDGSLNPIFQAGDVRAAGGTTLSVSADDGDSEVGGTANFSTAGGDYGAYSGGAVSDGDSGTVHSLVLGQYTGTGTYTVTVNASQIASYGSLGGVQAQIDPLSTSGEVKIVYTYIPEPATMGLLAAGAIGLLRRRRR